MGILRLLLALSVVSVHAESILGCRFVGGQIAVQAFYIISGFYMALILNEKYINKPNTYSLFITNRFLRLYPVYLTVLFLTVVLCVSAFLFTKGATFPKIDYYKAVTFNPFTFIYLILSNILLFGQDVVLFLGIHPDSGNLFFTTDFTTTHPELYHFMFVPQAWSLSIELAFYLIAPFIVRKSVRVQLLFIVGTLMLRIYIFDILHLRSDPWTYRFFPTELLFFILGSVAYRLKNRFANMTVSSVLAFSLLAYIVVFTVLYFYLPKGELLYSPFSMKELLYFLSIFFIVPILFIYFKNSKFDNKIGELSYPVYISHKFILMTFTGLPLAFIKEGWFVAIATLVFSLLLNKYISEPVDKLRQSRVKKYS
jgi:peptidoglycan/LPS O-acetylase OafA/YrhL